MDQKYWDTKYKLGIRKPTNLFAKKAYKLISSKKNVQLLDIGCGNGNDSLYFAKKGIRVLATDFSKIGLKTLKNTTLKENIKNITIKQLDISKARLPKNKFDVVYAHLSLHYFKDKQTTEIFNKIHLSLKKGGLFFVKCKSTDDELYGKGQKLEENIFLSDHTRHFFTKDYMLSKLNKFKTAQVKKTTSFYAQQKCSFIEGIAKK